VLLQYYTALEQAQMNNNKEPFLELITNTVKETSERILKAVAV
jgi:hypothetical protein